MLAERGYNTYCVGKWHLTPGEECNLAAFKGRWPLGRGFERFYGFLGGESNQWYPDLVHDNHQIDPPGDARGGVPPLEGPRRQGDRDDPATPRSIDPDKPFFMYLAPGCGHAPHHVFEEWADKYKGKFDQGYEAIRAGILERQKELGLLPEDTELSPINPHGEPERTGPDGQPWPVLDTVRPWDSLSDDEQRLFARMAEVFAGFVSYTDDQLGRVIDYLEESGQLDNTIDRRDLGQRRQRRGRAERLVQRVAVLQRRAPTRPTSTLPHIDELGTPRVVQPLLHRLGVGVRHAVPVLEALGRATRAASPTCASSRGRRRSRPRRTIRQQYIHAVDVVPTVYDLLGIEPPAVIKGYTQSPIEGESFAAALTDPKVPGKDDAVLRDARPALDLPQGWLACTVHPPIGGLGQVRPRRVGALRPRARPRAVEERRRRRSRSGSRR